jgi:5-(carboxyamino)imidazole ribonucleotide synthase
MTTIGIIGGGQLGRMLSIAALPLGLRCIFVDPASDAPVDVFASRIRAEYADETALLQLANNSDIITYEFENVPVASARMLTDLCPVFPAPTALEAAQDRLVEKDFFRACNIPTPPYQSVVSYADLVDAVAQIGLPAVLKTRRLGYDGKGQYVIKTEGDMETAWQSVGSGNVPLILEGFIAFDREVSVLAVRGRDGTTAFYPLVWNTHREGILRLSVVPAPGVDATLQALAQSYATQILERLDYVGLLAIELFQVGNQLLANEMAPRVHNSGHWTIEGAETSQFENHLRAIIGWPLGATDARGHVAMVNLIGSVPETDAVLAIPGAHLHLYGKEPRPGRKLGHITLCANDATTLQRHIEQIKALLAEI